MVDITTQPLHTEKIIQSVADPSAGGIDVFIGTTRDKTNGNRVLYLHYEAYLPMALKKMQELADQARKQWNVSKISIVHRIGRIEVGEASVVIAVSAAHRNEAFEACRYLIDTLKRDVPIWKKEFFEDGSVWVDGAK